MSARYCRMFVGGTGRNVWQETSEYVQEILRDSLQRPVCCVWDRCEVSFCRVLADIDPELRQELLGAFGRGGSGGSRNTAVIRGLSTNPCRV
jgi:hypothetical protein